MREVGGVFQSQNAVLAGLQHLRERNSYLLSGFVLQHSHSSGLPVTQLEDRDGQLTNSRQDKKK